MQAKSLLWYRLDMKPPHLGHAHPEKYYQNRWCQEHHGQAEVVLPDQTRLNSTIEHFKLPVDTWETN